MFGSQYIISLIESQRAYRDAQHEKVYRDVVDNVSLDVLQVCYDRDPNEWQSRYDVPEELDSRILLKLLQRRCNRICRGVPVDVRLVYRKGVAQIVCRVPPHNSLYKW